MTLEERIQAGIDGKFEGLNNGLGKVNKVLHGVQRGVYQLLGGLSGTYKTTLADFILLNALEDAENKGIEFNCFYFSFEIDELNKKTNWLSVRIKKKYGITISPEIIKGYGKNRLNKEQLELVKAEIPYIDNLFSKIKFRFKATNPTGIFNELWKYFESQGNILYEDYVDHENKTQKRIVGYTPNNPDAYTLIVLDHLLLLLKERGFTDKEVIDKMSEYMVILRNLFGASGLFISQFNDGLSSIDRAKFKGVDLSPQITDFKSSRNPFADADQVISTMSAYKMDLKMCLGYDISKLEDSFIMLKVIKNRLGRDNVAVGLLAEPTSGSFIPLPDVGSPELAQLYNNL